jgi:copper homeostasis protein
MAAPVVEICVESASGAVAARRGGANRVEICAHREVGGITPDSVEIANVCRLLDVPVHVLIRPREGGFVYNAEEFAVMTASVRSAKEIGASGVVIGMLHLDGTIDRERTAALIALARPMSVTFHKAFDATREPISALDTLIALGVERILTSGQAPTAREGLDLLAALVRHAGGRIAIMAGGSITVEDPPALRASGVREIHAGSCVVSDGQTDPELVRRLVAAWSGNRPG